MPLTLLNHCVDLEMEIFVFSDHQMPLPNPYHVTFAHKCIICNIENIRGQCSIFGEVQDGKVIFYCYHIEQVTALRKGFARHKPRSACLNYSSHLSTSIF